jgi:cobalt-zinc-cadmium efflux system membrane fusion protein
MKPQSHSWVGVGRVLLVVGTAVLAGVLLLPALAHEGHQHNSPTQDVGLDGPRSVSPQVARVIGLKTAEVDFGRVERVLRLTGTVSPEPDMVRAVAPRLSGVITAVRARVGEVVRTGDILVELDSPELAQLDAQIAQAKARSQRLAAEAEAAADLARLADAELARLEANPQGVAANTLSDRRVAALTARSAAHSTRLELDQARAEFDAFERVRTVRLPPDLARVTPEGRVALLAPIDGVVTARAAIVGAGVQDGTTLLTLADHARVQVEAELPESLADRLGAAGGQAVRLRRDPDGPVVAQGVVRFLSPAVDPVKRTAHVLVDAPNSPGVLRAGMFVDASIVLSEADDAVVVPVSAVLTDGPAVFVFLKEGEVFIKRDIVPGQRSDAVVEVLDGLVPGDIVVTQGAYALTQVRPDRPAGADAATGSGPAQPAAPSPAPPAHDHSAHGHTHPG